MRTLQAVSGRIYGWLLRVYPADFRNAFGTEMHQVFCDACRDAMEAEGLRGLAKHWMHMLRDLVVTAFQERLDAWDRRSWGLLLLAILCGLLIGYVDFHSSEVQAPVFLLLLFTFVFSAALPRNPWRWAIAIGFGVPVLHIVNHLLGFPPPYPVQPNILAAFIALIPAFIGAATGSMARWMIAPPNAP